MRKIIHIDMDAFFASIEQRDNGEYRNKPLVVGYSGPRGVVAAASYEARQYGIRSAMSSKVALQKCPHLIFAPSRIDVYKSVSHQIMDIFEEYTDLVEPLSFDEAFLDVTSNHKNIELATQIAKEIKTKILETTQLTASAGVSFNKFLAKIASDYNKPNGLFVIRPKQAEGFVEKLPIEQFYGVGKVTAQQMHKLGIKTGLDLKQKTELELATYFGKQGHIYYQNARGIDDRAVNPDRVRKSVGAEITFEYDMDSHDDLAVELRAVVKEVARRTEKIQFKGRTISLKIKYADFKNISRSKTLLHPIVGEESLYQLSQELLSSIDIRDKVRLIGVSVRNSDNVWQDGIQLQIDFGEDFL